MHIVRRIHFKDIMQCYSKIIKNFDNYQEYFLETTFYRFIMKLKSFYGFIFLQTKNHLSIYDEIHFQISSFRHSNNLNATLFFSCWKVLIYYAMIMICLSCIYCTFIITHTRWSSLFQSTIETRLKCALFRIQGKSF